MESGGDMNQEALANTLDINHNRTLLFLWVEEWNRVCNLECWAGVTVFRM